MPFKVFELTATILRFSVIEKMETVDSMLCLDQRAPISLDKSNLSYCTDSCARLGNDDDCLEALDF